jgi:hypothetical protein
MAWSGFQVRTYRRFSVQCVLYFASGALHGAGTVWNLSAGGCRVDSDVPLPKGARLKLFVMLPDGAQPVVVEQAVVCWSRGREVGLSTRHLTVQHAARLQTFLSDHASFLPLAY